MTLILALRTIATASATMAGARSFADREVGVSPPPMQVKQVHLRRQGASQQVDPAQQHCISVRAWPETRS